MNMVSGVKSQPVPISWNVSRAGSSTYNLVNIPLLYILISKRQYIIIIIIISL